MVRIGAPPAKPATGWRSPPPPNGSTASPKPTKPAPSTKNYAVSAATPSWSSTKWDTSPFEADAADLFFRLISSRYERAPVIVSSNKPFGQRGEVFGDPVVAAAMIDRLIHQAEVVSPEEDSYRLKDRDLGRVPNRQHRVTTTPARVISFQPVRSPIFRRCWQPPPVYSTWMVSQGSTSCD